MYSYKSNGHQHLWDGKRMTGITTVLGCIAKPALIGWASNMCADYILANSTDEGEYIKVNKLIVADARKAHTKKKEAAGDVGKSVHAAIEEWVKNKTEPTLDEQGMKMFENFRKWAVDNKVKFLESEKHLYSDDWFVAGICDIIVEIEGEVYIADIKTGGVYAEAFWQCAGYNLLAEKMGIYPNIKGYIILGLLKDGTFKESRSVSVEDHKKAFMACLDIYRIKQKTENQIL